VIFNRRLFLSLLVARPAQASPLRVAVLEKFDVNSRTTAVLVHHADPATRDAFAAWLQRFPKSAVRLRLSDGVEVSATIFRVRMCFGRGLIFFEKPVQIRERDILMLVA
jgi:hypothetical protein